MRIRTEKIVIPELTENLEGYSILHLSDIHFNDATKKNEMLWQLMRTNTADLILVTGDFITHERYIDSLCNYFGGSKALDGIYGILGNHDRYFLTPWQHIIRHRLLKHNYIPNDWKRLIHALNGLGIKILVNEGVSIKSSRGPQVYVEGTDDPVLGNPVIADVTSDYEYSALKILMSHSPDILYSTDILKKKFDILLCGHTHGGQVWIPGIGPIVTGTTYAKRSEALGLYKASIGLNVNVSSGIGYANLPIRINCLSEVVEIRLSRSK